MWTVKTRSPDGTVHKGRAKSLDVASGDMPNEFLYMIVQYKPIKKAAK